MTKTVAQSLGLKPILHYTLSQNYGAGRIHYYLAMAESLRIGSVEFKNVPVQVFDEDWVPAHITEGVEGVFGLGMLQDFLVHVDYTRQQIRLSELPPVPQAQDVYGREVWSTVIPGSPTPSRNGNDWGAFNRSIAPNMQTWTRYFGGTSPYLLTKFGPGPERLFELDLNERHPRLSSAAQAGIGTAKAAGIIFPGSKYSGYFMKFSGIFVPINSWTTERFDNGSERLDLEISGIIDQSALLTTPFSIDYRDQLIHFETSAEK